MKRMIVAGNWKMNMTPSSAKAFSEELSEKLKQHSHNCDIVICPPYISIPAVAETFSGSRVSVGAQNCHTKEKGAFTGEISATMLKDAGCTYCIVGHSERRRDFAENDTEVAEKIKAILQCDMTPILCVGENIEQRKDGSTFDVVRSQLENTLFELKEIDYSHLVIAYEPIWAIGTGLAATPEQAQEVHGFIDEVLSRFELNAPILYGGSVTDQNAQELFSQPNIHGALVGGASLSVQSFVGIINATNVIK